MRTIIVLILYKTMLFAYYILKNSTNTHIYFEQAKSHTIL